MENFEQGISSELNPVNVGENFIKLREQELQLALATMIDPNDLPQIEEILNLAAQGGLVDGGKNA